MNNERFEQLKNDFLPRFWDTENNVMVYPEMFIPNNEITFFIRYNIGKVLPEILTIDEMLSNPRFKEMRPTGLKDKNGTLIYEGDLIKNIIGDIFEVAWKEISTGFEGYNQNEYIETSRFYLFEIIGNIHKKASQ